MAISASDISVALDQIAKKISDQRSVMKNLVIKNAQAASVALAALPTDYAEAIDAINAYGTSDAFEANAKATLAKFTADFQALKTVADQVAAATV